VAVPSYKRLYLNQQGDVIHEEVNRQNMTSWDLAYYLLRANYDQVDSSYLEGGKSPESRPSDGKVTYRYGCTVTDVVDEGAHVRVQFKRKLDDDSEVEDSLTTRLLVAADGPSSTIRSILEPSVDRKYAGYVVIRGTVPEPEGSQAALDVFRERFCFFHAPGM
jgi:2-polyprenyl-6-methoxyphenol hydroxylase-like FAD-dependent oxidoreductase